MEGHGEDVFTTETQRSQSFGDGLEGGYDDCTTMFGLSPGLRCPGGELISISFALPWRPFHRSRGRYHFSGWTLEERGCHV
jgi:hypothetical protein